VTDVTVVRVVTSSHLLEWVGTRRLRVCVDMSM
jgi:hypothetical protein